jgi:hypothetical protein
MDSDPVFRKQMLRKNPQLLDWMNNSPNLSNSPAGLTWHHHERMGILSLVNRADHGTYRSIYHPTGNGGRDMWGGGKLGREGKLNEDGTIIKK